MGKRAVHVLQKRFDGGDVVEHLAALKVQLEAAVVHVDGADEGDLAIRHDGFAVDKPRCEGVYLDMVCQQLGEVALRHEIGELVVGDAGHDEADVHAAVGGQAECAEHGLVDGEVGRGDVDGLAGAGDQLEEKILGGVLGVVVGTVHHRLAETLRHGTVHRAVVVVLVVRLTVHTLPHMQELAGQSPRALALQADAAVLPVAEADDEVGVLVGDVGSAGVGGLAVDAGDLAVVAVVEVKAVDVVVDGVEYLDLHAGIQQRLHLLVGHTHHAAEIVENQLDLHAHAALIAENIGQAIPDLALRHDEILQEDETLRLLQTLQHIVQIRLAGGQVRHLRVAVEGEALAAEVVCHGIPLRGGLPQPFQIGAGDLLLGARLLDGGELFQAETLGLAVAVPEQVEDQSHHRHEQHQNDPADLIAGGTGARPDTHCHHACQHLQHRIRQSHALHEQVAEDDHQRDLRQQQHRHQHKAQRGGYAPLCPLLYSGLSQG